MGHLTRILSNEFIPIHPLSHSLKIKSCWPFWGIDLWFFGNLPADFGKSSCRFSQASLKVQRNEHKSGYCSGFGEAYCSLDSFCTTGPEQQPPEQDFLEPNELRNIPITYHNAMPNTMAMNKY